MSDKQNLREVWAEKVGTMVRPRSGEDEEGLLLGYDGEPGDTDPRVFEWKGKAGG